VELTPAAVPPGPVAFRVTNAGSIPHAMEVEGRGVEKRMSQLDPGSAATLVLNLKAGDYEVYCPVGKGSHKMLGMMSHVVVGKATGDRAANRRRNEHAEYGDHEAAEYGAREGHEEGHEKGAGHGEHDHDEPREGARTMREASPCEPYTISLRSDCSGLVVISACAALRTRSIPR